MDSIVPHETLEWRKELRLLPIWSIVIMILVASMHYYGIHLYKLVTSFVSCQSVFQYRSGMHTHTHTHTLNSLTGVVPHTHRHTRVVVTNKHK